MQVYIEDISEDYGAHGITVYSLVQGMKSYIAEVRASGIDLYRSNDYGNGTRPLDEDDPQRKELYDALVKEIYKGKWNG